MTLKSSFLHMSDHARQLSVLQAMTERKTRTENIIRVCKYIRQRYPDNLCCRHLPSYLQSSDACTLTDEEFREFFDCVKTGIAIPSSSIGCYAMKPFDYIRFKSFFSKVIRDCHKPRNNFRKHAHDWNVGALSELNLSDFGLKNPSIRVRVGRNLKGFHLAGAMDKIERMELETKMLQVFTKLIEMKGGRVFSLSPDRGNEGDNPNLISTERYQELVAAHVMFKDMSKDKYLVSSGIANDWPYGRGCWQSADGHAIVWYGEEDHLRIICKMSATNLADPFRSLKELLDVIEAMNILSFAKDDSYGYISSCPSNLGTSMRASIHLRVPKVLEMGRLGLLKEECLKIGLSLRGHGGEHTRFGSDGTVEISPSAKLFVTEVELARVLYDGVQKILELEREVATETPGG